MRFCIKAKRSSSCTKCKKPLRQIFSQSWNKSCFINDHTMKMTWGCDFVCPFLEKRLAGLRALYSPDGLSPAKPSKRKHCFFHHPLPQICKKTKLSISTACNLNQPHFIVGFMHTVATVKLSPGVSKSWMDSTGCSWSRRATSSKSCRRMTCKNESRCFIIKNPTDLKMHEC